MGTYLGIDTYSQSSVRHAFGSLRDAAQRDELALGSHPIPESTLYLSKWLKTGKSDLPF